MSSLYGAGLLGFLLAGLPVAGTLLLVGLIGVWWAGVPLSIVAQRMAFGLDSFTLIAIPLFLLMGNLMNATGVTKRVFIVAAVFVGHWKAGLAQVNALASVVFSGMSGSALADAAGLGSVEIRAMREAGYRPAYAAAITAASATVGPVIPPSIAAVLYAFIADVSVGRMFLSGVVPVLLMTVALMLTIRLRASSSGMPVLPRASGREKGSALIAALPAIAAPFLLIGGMRSGVLRALVKAGCAVVATDLRIPADADGAEWVAADLATEEGRADVVRVASSGPLGGIVCAAGVIDAAPWDMVEPGDIAQILSVNAVAPFLLVRDLTPVLAPPASVVFVGSVAGSRAVPDAAAYAASKAALRSFSATLAVAVADRGIRVNTLASGLIDTAMTDTLNGRLAVRAGTGADEIARARAASIPAGRTGTPEELAGACLWLLGDGATYVSGATLVAAGGVLAGTA